MMKIILINLFVFSSLFLKGQNYKDSILGTWELEKEKRISQTVYPIKGMKNQNEIKRELMMFFQSNGKVDINDMGGFYKDDYSILDSILNIGGTRYKIIKLHKVEMVLKNITGIVPVTYYFKKTNKKLTPVKEFEIISEKFSNGQNKIEGQKVNGYKNSIWVEWYDTGKIKKVTHYNFDVPYMKIEFDENGAIKSRYYYDLNSKTFKTE